MSTTHLAEGAPDAGAGSLQARGRAALRTAARTAAWPARNFFDGRFTRVHQHLEGLADQSSRVTSHTEERLDDLARRVDTVTRSLAGVTDQMQGLVELERRLTAELQAVTEITVLRGGIGTVDDAPALRDAVMRSMHGSDVGSLSQAAADMLNWATGHDGFAAQQHVWFNHPLRPEHVPGGVRIGLVTERILEIPYVSAAVAALPRGSHILDVGCAESLVALSAASAGHDVIANDIHEYPLQHPRLRAVARPLQLWEGPDRPIDLAILLSSLEHVGLGSYGDAPIGLDQDRAVLERIAEWLAPGGRIVMTAPYGPWNVDDFQRVYDREHLEALLQGWTVVDRHWAVQTTATTWDATDTEPAADAWGPMGKGVVMFQAERR